MLTGCCIAFVPCRLFPATPKAGRLLPAACRVLAAPCNLAGSETVCCIVSTKIRLRSRRCQGSNAAVQNCAYFALLSLWPRSSNAVSWASGISNCNRSACTTLTLSGCHACRLACSCRWTTRASCWRQQRKRPLRRRRLQKMTGRRCRSTLHMKRVPTSCRGPGRCSFALNLCFLGSRLRFYKKVMSVPIPCCTFLLVPCLPHFCNAC